LKLPKLDAEPRFINSSANMPFFSKGYVILFYFYE